ncbi:unnamed protein product [Aphis gossypii]|uniref:THAP domain-containing protein 9 n=1 Tax=Aphis gossypii TaxID=80765 RepID=A0A9P0IVC4_APHGO|nr:unnamed protein product [Aphis gossypii]
MFLRESLSVNSRSLTYIGLEDFGNEELVRKNSSLKANHGLVFMWSSLTENMVQPIAVFASAGPVKGIELSKLVVKAILLMEDAGAHVVGITCDGASTNRTMWNSLGVSAKKQDFKNYIENPFDTSRKVYMFSDAPHLLKNIRNRLFQNKTLTVDPSKFSIKWEQYLNIFKTEGCSLTKVCPKLTKNHFELNNLAKMKVKYAAQILHQAIEWLNNWELNLIRGLIKEKDFLTRSTYDGLKITLQSTIDLVNYLINDCGSAYVLTAKFNQDSLEKFFGILNY